MTLVEDGPTTVLGTRLLRREDPALLTGEAKFTNDLVVPGALHMVVVRSPYAHAAIAGIDLDSALAAAGVVAAFTGADLAHLWAAPMPCAWPVTTDMKNPAHYPLATGKACYVGDGVAVVLATSEVAARDAAELVDVRYEPQAAVVDLEDALSDRIVIHPDLGTNKSYQWDLKIEGTPGQVDQAFADAAYKVSERYVQQRLIPIAMEPRAVCAVPQPFGGDLTLYSTTQVPHYLHRELSRVLRLSPARIRVIQPPLGGAFGGKSEPFGHEFAAAKLAMLTGRPVKFLLSREEEFYLHRGRHPMRIHLQGGSTRQLSHRLTAPHT